MAIIKRRLFQAARARPESQVDFLCVFLCPFCAELSQRRSTGEVGFVRFAGPAVAIIDSPAPKPLSGQAEDLRRRARADLCTREKISTSTCGQACAIGRFARLL